MTRQSEIFSSMTVALHSIFTHTRRLRALSEGGDLCSTGPLLDACDALITNLNQRFMSLDSTQQRLWHHEHQPLMEALLRENEQLLRTLREHKAEVLQQLRHLQQRQCSHAYPYEELL